MTIADESIPPLNRQATGKSDLNLFEKISINKFLSFSFLSLYEMFLILIIGFCVQISFLFISKFLSIFKAVEELIAFILQKNVSSFKNNDLNPYEINEIIFS